MWIGVNLSVKASSSRPIGCPEDCDKKSPTLSGWGTTIPSMRGVAAGTPSSRDVKGPIDTRGLRRCQRAQRTPRTSGSAFGVERWYKRQRPAQSCRPASVRAIGYFGKRSNSTTTTMRRMRPTEPPPMIRALPRTGENNRRCITCLSFRMAMGLPPFCGVLYTLGRSCAMRCNPTAPPMAEESPRQAPSAALHFRKWKP